MPPNHKKKKPPLPKWRTSADNRPFMPILVQSLFARARLRNQTRRGNPMTIADVSALLRGVIGIERPAAPGVSTGCNEVLFEALEPRILLSADGFMPPPTPEMFDDNPEVEDVELPPSELDESVAEQLPPEEVDTLEPSGGDTSGSGEGETEQSGGDANSGTAGNQEQAGLAATAGTGGQVQAQIGSVSADDPDRATAGTYTITFGDDFAYEVFDVEGEVVAGGTFDPDEPTISFNGLDVTIEGVPDSGTSLGFSYPGEAGEYSGDGGAAGASGFDSTDDEASSVSRQIEETGSGDEQGRAADGALGDPQDTGDEPFAQSSSFGTTSSAVQQEDRSLQIVFVDSAIKDYQSLIDHLAGESTADSGEPSAESDVPQSTEASGTTDDTDDSSLLVNEPSGEDTQFEAASIAAEPADPRPVPTRILETRGAEIRVYVIDSRQDGIEQVSRVLEAYEGVDTVHILSHGSAGALALGSTRINAGNLDTFEENPEGWGSALTPGGDIQLYGCNVADGEQGARFIRDFSAATGADVAASSNDTGAAAFGGDWNLEFTVGVVESTVINDSLAASNFAYLLAAPNIVGNGTGNVSVNGSGANDHWRIVDSGTTLTISNLATDGAVFTEVLTVSSGGTLIIDLVGGNDIFEFRGAPGVRFQPGRSCGHHHRQRRHQRRLGQPRARGAGGRRHRRRHAVGGARRIAVDLRRDAHRRRHHPECVVQRQRYGRQRST
ncbi:MAG: DUF4347 domain-containing protein [Gammaproteobacteria bacterium]|nr:DUF4347 domain-containing protein [Gammaproteobacteria bacterium]